MENIFLDTNVVMDYILGRNESDDVRNVFRCIASKKCTAYISVGSFYTITYLVEVALKSKGLDKQERVRLARKILVDLLNSVELSFQSSTFLLDGVNDERFMDLEDSYQYQAAVSANCSYIITRNVKDFKGVDDQDVRIVLPKDFPVK